jgi:hypothetical protein
MFSILIRIFCSDLISRYLMRHADALFKDMIDAATAVPEKKQRYKR